MTGADFKDYYLPIGTLIIAIGSAIFTGLGYTKTKSQTAITQNAEMAEVAIGIRNLGRLLGNLKKLHITDPSKISDENFKMDKILIKEFLDKFDEYALQLAKVSYKIPYAVSHLQDDFSHLTECYENGKIYSTTTSLLEEKSNYHHLIFQDVYSMAIFMIEPRATEENPTYFSYFFNIAQVFWKYSDALQNRELVEAARRLETKKNNNHK